MTFQEFQTLHGNKEVSNPTLYNELKSSLVTDDKAVIPIKALKFREISKLKLGDYVMKFDRAGANASGSKTAAGDLIMFAFGLLYSIDDKGNVVAQVTKGLQQAIIFTENEDVNVKMIKGEYYPCAITATTSVSKGIERTFKNASVMVS